MNEYIQSVILGVVQGLTEFLPISSSGHLVVLPKLFGWQDQGVIFDIAMHVATLLAVLVYFRTDVAAIGKSLFSRAATREVRSAKTLALHIGIATVPVLLTGIILSSFIETTGRQIISVASLMIFVGIIFLVVEKFATPRKDLQKLTWYDSLSIGLAQAAALLPGVSRSGSTIIAGIYTGLKREAATRFSFLLAIPAIVLAGGYSVLKLLLERPELVYSPLAIVAGFGAAFVSGLIAIAFMMAFVKKHRLNIFAYYRILFGLALIAVYLFYGGIFQSV
jgi:undecaprenyl-diphosphatase